TCFNDGYHIVHHLKPAMHWTEYPGEFLRNTDRYAREDAFIFQKLDFHMVWFFLMMKRYDWLAKSMVRVNGSTLTEEKAIALMKERTKKIVSVPETENEFAYAY
ncbi:MAG: fatty acid desaturase, partial [Cytophagales bacterium]|nr:fatty acid desaturase [Cytophagales bacterium]